MLMLSNEKAKVINVPIAMIIPNPAQPRRSFSEHELDSLAQSIRQNGLLQPLIVRKIGNTYELIAGERRMRACQKAGFTTVACIINDCDEKQSAVFALLENLQRQDLQMFEEADGIQKLIAVWGVSQEEAAARLGKSQSTLANKIRLLRLTLPERQKIVHAGLTERHARALLRIDNKSLREKVLEDIIEKKLNVQQTDELVERILSGADVLDEVAYEDSMEEPVEIEVQEENSEPVKKEKRKKSKRTLIIKDIRVFMNTIHHAVETMQLSGIDAVSEKNETDDYIECVIRIPKQKSNEDLCAATGGKDPV